MSNAAKRLRKGQIVAEAKEAKVLKEVIKGCKKICRLEKKKKMPVLINISKIKRQTLADEKVIR